MADKVLNRRAPLGLGNRPFEAEVRNMEVLDYIAPPLIDHVVWSCCDRKASASSVH